MKTIIETDETSFASCEFEKQEEMVLWEDLSRDEQIKITNALQVYCDLYSKFIKE